MICKDINTDAPECEGELMGFEIRGVYDGVLFWGCSQGHAIPRKFGVPYRDEASRRYANEYLSELGERAS